MIHYIKRNDLDVEKYNSCIKKAKKGNVFGYSWYLDIACDNWDVLMFDDYTAVMPIPWRKKFGFSYVYLPFWILQLGVYSTQKNVAINPFEVELKKRFRFVEFYFNEGNFSYQKNANHTIRAVQKLVIKDSYKDLFSNYRKDRKKDLHKATGHKLVRKWNDSVINLLSLYKKNIGTRLPEIKEKDYNNLEKIITVCIQKKKAEILSIYSKENQLLASGLFLKHKKEITILVSSTDFNERKKGANTFLIDSAIQKYQTKYKTFNFGGSSINSIANYFKSFNAKTSFYNYLKVNNLPWYIKLFKK